MNKAKIRKALDACVNAHCSWQIKGDEFHVYLDGSFGNMIDSSSMTSLLAMLKQLCVVSPDTQTMWVGMNPSGMYLWCRV